MPLVESHHPAAPDVVASLEHITGPSRGAISWLPGALFTLHLDRSQRVHVSDDAPAGTADGTVAVLRREGGTFSIEATGDDGLWVNGRPVRITLLRHGDIIEFGEHGPLSRFRVFSARQPIVWSVDDIFGDLVAYLRASRKPIVKRVAWGVGDFGRRLVLETTALFRIGVVAALIVLSVVLYNQSRRSAELQAGMEAERARLEGVAAAMTEAREKALTPSDLKALRSELEQSVSSNAERLRALEESAVATQRLIARSIRSVAFLQSAYGLKHAETGRMLRHVLSKDGIPIQTPFGQPLLSLDGEGPVAEVQGTGTAFLVSEGKVLVTNRHVALPWLGRTDPDRLAAAGMEPVMLKFLAFFPGREEPIEVTLRHAGDDIDLAVLKMIDPPADLHGLELADESPRAGDEVVVMGYPTGLRSLLAQSGAAFVKQLEEEDVGFWAVARRLAEARMIVPLASQGIVGQVAGEAIVYDAETTHGGSGGPVLDASGRVIAVNTAILPEFGGSNLGLPVAKLRAILAEVGG